MAEFGICNFSDKPRNSSQGGGGVSRRSESVPRRPNSDITKPKKRDASVSAASLKRKQEGEKSNNFHQENPKSGNIMEKDIISEKKTNVTESSFNSKDEKITLTESETNSKKIPDDMGKSLPEEDFDFDEESEDTVESVHSCETDSGLATEEDPSDNSSDSGLSKESATNSLLEETDNTEKLEQNTDDNKKRKECDESVIASKICYAILEDNFVQEMSSVESFLCVEPQREIVGNTVDMQHPYLQCSIAVEICALEVLKSCLHANDDYEIVCKVTRIPDLRFSSAIDTIIRQYSEEIMTLEDDKDLSQHIEPPLNIPLTKLDSQENIDMKYARTEETLMTCETSDTQKNKPNRESCKSESIMDNNLLSESEETKIDPIITEESEIISDIATKMCDTHSPPHVLEINIPDQIPVVQVHLSSNDLESKSIEDDMLTLSNNVEPSKKREIKGLNTAQQKVSITKSKPMPVKIDVAEEIAVTSSTSITHPTNFRTIYENNKTVIKVLLIIALVTFLVMFFNSLLVVKTLDNI